MVNKSEQSTVIIVLSLSQPAIVYKTEHKISLTTTGIHKHNTGTGTSLMNISVYSSLQLPTVPIPVLEFAVGTGTKSNKDNLGIIHNAKWSKQKLKHTGNISLTNKLICFFFTTYGTGTVCAAVTVPGTYSNMNKLLFITQKAKV